MGDPSGFPHSGGDAGVHEANAIHLGLAVGATHLSEDMEAEIRQLPEAGPQARMALVPAVRSLVRDAVGGLVGDEHLDIPGDTAPDLRELVGVL